MRYRPRSAKSVRSGIDPDAIPVATLAARQEAEELAVACAERLNNIAGRETAAAKVSVLLCEIWTIMQVAGKSMLFWPGAQFFMPKSAAYKSVLGHRR